MTDDDAKRLAEIRHGDYGKAERTKSAGSPEFNMTFVLRLLDEARAAAGDDPLWDGTDAAHPAWWRGNDAGVLATVRIVNEILDGKRSGPAHYGSPELTDLHRRLLALVELAR